MERLFASGLALAFAVIVLATFAGTPEAQTGTQLLDACEAGKQEIKAIALPDVVEPGECPVGERRIVDGPVASVVPPVGQSVYAEVLTTSGAQELGVERLPGGTIELTHVGEESEEPAASDLSRATNREGCFNPTYTDLDHKVTGTLDYRFKVSTTPPGLARLAARNAIRKGALNVFGTRNNCRMGDRVPVALRYTGSTGAPAQVGDGLCGTNDGLSVVAFGDLRSGVVAAACTISNSRPALDEVVAADIKINRVDFRWTTVPDSRSCRGAYDVEAVTTHEWGHVFGLGHVAEYANPNLTMSPTINGTCQADERSLGRGDVLGLDSKYD
jgi:hypothetical protein